MTATDNTTPSLSAFNSISKSQRQIRIRVFEALANKPLSEEDRHTLLFSTAPMLSDVGFQEVLEAVILKKEIIKPSQGGLFT